MSPDNQLLQRMQRGDRSALREIYRKFANDMLTVATCIVGDVSAGEDVLHDVFVTLAGGVRVRSSLKGFLMTCVANRARDRLRWRGSQNRLNEAVAAEQLDPPAVADPASELVSKESARQAYKALAGLPAEQREVITLRLHADMTFRQIGRLQRASVNTARSRYLYGIKKLRELLGEGVVR